ncbi:tetratricopeptide repeat protein [Desulforhopalus singaporensis]|uniref:Putative negative regulator of RcsB-dependent stress response n=1 Tax=Desulforhopalus singaporensis TaxID=91360 RepID=A0A1H0PIC2_9BACT|nr:tetratricopeptide repeat protein [Desulforhopalus singaporensis]SDP04744.1 Putative negative regulator of RcsB-dependent stress response [Desulforhopalus singaporensis]
MSQESAFNKRLAPETTMDKIEGILEHFNLPPNVIAFIRRNKKAIIAIICVAVICVVSWSLYNSYQKKLKEKSSSALSLALSSADSARSAALGKVIADYAGTSAALWAEVELAHTDMKNKDYTDAAQKYSAITDEVDRDNPLYGLALYGHAQALEAMKSYSEATARYEMLQEITGYKLIAYLGKGRVEEEQGNLEQAIAIYNNFLLDVGDDPEFSQAKTEIETRMAHVKAMEK